MFCRHMHQRFSTVFKTQAGHKFYGQLGDPNASPRPRKEVQNLPHFSMAVDRSAPVSEGELVTNDEREFLLIGQHVMTNIKKFLAMEINSHMRWERMETVIDPVSKMPSGQAPVLIMASLPVVIEPMRSIEEADFNTNLYRIFAASNVLDGDYLDGYQVSRSYKLFGATVVEAG